MISRENGSHHPAITEDQRGQPVRVPADKLEGEEAPEATAKPSKPAVLHSFDMAEGVWIGEVREVGVEVSYSVTIEFRGNGAGEVHYVGAGYDCKGVLAPRSAGAELVFIETIVLARDQCADGEVRITFEGDRMDWSWINEWREVQATAVLYRNR